MDKIALQTAISQFLDHTQAHSSLANTASVRQALSTFTRFITAVSRNTSTDSILSLTPETFHDYHTYVQQNYSPETEHAYLRAVIAFATFCGLPQATLDELETAIRTSRRKKEKRKPDIPFDSVAAVRYYLDQIPLPPPDPDLPIQRERLRVLRDKALIFTMLDTGLKASETTSLRVQQFNSRESALIFQNTLLPLLPDTARSVNSYLAERSSLDKAQILTSRDMLPLFARHDKRASDHVLPISRWTVGNIVSNWTQRATTTCPAAADPLTPSLLRHHFVASTLASTADLELTQMRARHKDRGTTRHYLNQSKPEPHD